MDQENEPFSLNSSRLSNGSRNNKKAAFSRNDPPGQNASNHGKPNELRKNLNASLSSSGSGHSHRNRRPRAPSVSSKTSRNSARSANNRTRNGHEHGGETGGFVVLNELTEADDETGLSNDNEYNVKDVREQINMFARLISNNNRNPESSESDTRLANSLVATINSLQLYKPLIDEKGNFIRKEETSLQKIIFKALFSCLFFALNISIDIYLAVHYYQDTDTNSTLFFSLTLGFVLLPGVLLMAHGFVSLMIRLCQTGCSLSNLSKSYFISQISYLMQLYYFVL